MCPFLQPPLTSHNNLVKFIGFAVTWFALAQGLIALLCWAIAEFLEFLARMQGRTGLAKTGRPAPRDLAQQIRRSLPPGVRAGCWLSALALTLLIFSALEVFASW